MFPKEEWKDRDVGRSRSNYLNSRILTIPSKASWKCSAQGEFDEFTSMEKCTQLLVIGRIWQSQTFDKPSYYSQENTAHLMKEEALEI